MTGSIAVCGGRGTDEAERSSGGGLCDVAVPFVAGVGTDEVERRRVWRKGKEGGGE
jgi:hypothetical protein